MIFIMSPQSPEISKNEHNERNIPPNIQHSVAALDTTKHFLETNQNQNR